MNDLKALLDLLPGHWVETFDCTGLTEVVLDLGRPLETRYGKEKTYHPDLLVDEADIQSICDKLSDFGADNRAGLNKTLHRISRIVDRNGVVSGLTCRVGKAYEGCADIIGDLIEAGCSILLLGPPGVGKTTKLRDVCKLASLELNRAVVIVDTSNEIAGDGTIPHEAVGRARRLQVPKNKMQHEVMQEAVENHTPEVLVVDEIGNFAEAQACRTFAQRGVQLIATAHGKTLQDLIENPELKDLIGGIKLVTLGDASMTRQGLTQKTQLERCNPPTFDVVIEILSYDRIGVYTDIGKAIDVLLKGGTVEPEIRQLFDDGWDIIQPMNVEPVKASSFPEKLGRSKDKFDQRNKGRSGKYTDRRRPKRW